MKRTVSTLALLWCILCMSLSAQKHMMYRIYLTDKRGTSGKIAEPQTFLSKRAIERRMHQSLPIDSTDLPVSEVYLKQLTAYPICVKATSKWNNTVLVKLTDHKIMDEIAAQPYVRDTMRVWIDPDTTLTTNPKRKEALIESEKKSERYEGMAYDQLHMLGADSLHKAGYEGQGMHIAVIDAGFYNADVIPAFTHLRLLGTRDFVQPDSDIFAQNSHGMKVLSCLAANQPYQLMGSAPKAAYWLLRSEDEASEQPVEEDYWAAAIEFADSVGVDVVNTSLGYNQFDDPLQDYHYRQLDGHHSLMSNSASMAASKGILLVCSAGNSGTSAWKKITPPADAKDILTVGAVTADRTNATFSSVGNTADGRIKPDVMALGFAAGLMGTNGVPSVGNGTSFASPIMCGAAACLWQALPHLTVKQLIELIQKSGDRAEYPDNIYGYGIPDLWKARQNYLHNNPHD